MLCLSERRICSAKHFVGENLRFCQFKQFIKLLNSVLLHTRDYISNANKIMSTLCKKSKLGISMGIYFMICVCDTSANKMTLANQYSNQKEKVSSISLVSCPLILSDVCFSFLRIGLNYLKLNLSKKLFNITLTGESK